MFKKIFHYFDKLEDRIRAKLSHIPILYAFIGGTLIVVFWRGIWSTADMLESRGGLFHLFFYGPNTIVWSVLALMLVGLFVSFFIGDRIILSGIKKEKRIDQKNELELQKEEEEIKNMGTKINQIFKDIEEIKKHLCPSVQTDIKFDKDKEN